MKSSYIIIIIIIFFFVFFYFPANAQKITEQEAASAGKILEVGVFQGEPTSLSHLIDEESFIRHVAEQSHVAQDPVFMRGFRSGFHMASLSDNIVQKLKSGSYRLVHIYEKDGRQHLLMRAFGEGGINYHDFSLIKIGDSVKADDMFIFLSGELLSTTLADYINIVASSGKNEKEINSAVALTLRVRELANSGDFPAVKKLVESAEPALRDSKPFQFQYLNACHQISDSLYKAALVNYSKLNPNDPTIYLKMIDFYFLQKDYQKAMEALNRLDSAVGNDPFLDYFRGNILYVQGKFAEAEQEYKKLFDYDPSISYSLMQVVHLYMKNENIDEAERAVERYRNAEYVRQDVLEEVYRDYPSLKK